MKTLKTQQIKQVSGGKFGRHHIGKPLVDKVSKSLVDKTGKVIDGIIN